MDRAARPRRGLELLASLAIPLGLVLAAPASADRTVSANQPVVVSDDITKRTIAVRSASGDEAAPSVQPGDDSTAKSGNDDNRSGLGDGTNPGMGDGRDNSPNEGTENPNQAPDDRGKPASKGKKGGKK